MHSQSRFAEKLGSPLAPDRHPGNRSGRSIPHLRSHSEQDLKLRSPGRALKREEAAIGNSPTNRRGN